MSRSTWAAIGAMLAAASVASPAPLPPPVLVAAMIALVAVLAIRARPGAVGSHGAGLRAAALLVAFVAVGLRGLAAGAPPAAGLPDGSGPWRAVVLAVGSPLDGDQRATLRIHGAAELTASARLPRYPAINAGDEIVAEGALRAPPDSDYGRYLERTGVVATLRSRTLEVVRRPLDPPSAIEGLRRSLAGGLAIVVPEPEAGLGAGILLGLRDRVDRDLAAAYTTAGVSHVVAISGWNIAIVAAVVGALAGSLPRRRRVALTLVVVAGYVLLVGTSPSVVRAAFMASIVMLARESGRTGRAASALGLTVVLLLLIEPSMLRDAGFQLSALATAGLLAWSAPLARWIDRRTASRLPRWVVEGLGVSLAAQAATLPVVVGTFGRLALVAPIVNLALAPIVPLAMAGGAVALLAGIAALLLGPLLPALLVGTVGWLPLAAMDRLVETAAAVPFASIDLGPGLSTVVAIGLAGAMLGVGGRSHVRRLVVSRRRTTNPMPGLLPAPGRSPRRSGRPAPGPAPGPARLLAGSSLVVLVAGWWILLAQPPGVARLTVLDVGQGDAVLVEGSRGARMLVDGGPDPERLLRVLDGRLPPWDRRLDLVLATHPHEDHVAGLPMILERYRVGEVLLNGLEGTSPGFRALAEGLAGRHVPHRVLATGDTVALDDVSMAVLWPDPGSVPASPLEDGSAINNTSLVLAGSASGRRFLLAGDMEAEVEATLVERGLGPVDLLKAGRHGSDTSSTQPLVDALRPGVAIISVGADNDYGHPSREVIDRLAAGGARVMRTDLHGTVQVDLAPGGLRIRAERPGLAGSRAARAGAGPRTTGRSALGYHRADAHPDPRRGSPRAPAPRSPALVPAPLARRRGDRRLARAARPRAGGLRRPTAGRDVRAASRCRQAAARRRSRARPPPRRGLRRLARADGLRGAGAGRPVAPGDQARWWAGL